MAELDLATAVTATPLAASLAGPPADAALTPYQGVLTPQHLDAPDAEMTAIFSGAAVHDLGWLRRVSVRGEDRSRWLSGMVTNAVETLPDNSGAYNLILNAQGRIQGDCYVWRDGDSLELELTVQQAEPLLAHLDRFIIMDDVELAPVEGISALGLAGPRAAEILNKVGIETLPEPMRVIHGQIDAIPVKVFGGYAPLVPHFTVWAAADAIPALWAALRNAGAVPAGSAAVETLRIVEGIPAFGVDIQSRDLAQETAQDRALNFSKGCYLGQEIVERIRSRGQVHRHLRQLELLPASSPASPNSASPDGPLPAPGTDLRMAGGGAEAKPVATLTSVTAMQRHGVRRIFAIGMVRAEAEVRSQALTYPGGEAVILHAPPQLSSLLSF